MKQKFKEFTVAEVPITLKIEARQVFITGSKSGLFNINEVGLKNLKSQKKTEQNIEENDTINHFQL